MGLDCANEALAQPAQAWAEGRNIATNTHIETNHMGKRKDNEAPHFLRTRESSLDPNLFHLDPRGAAICRGQGHGNGLNWGAVKEGVSLTFLSNF